MTTTIFRTGGSHVHLGSLYDNNGSVTMSKSSRPARTWSMLVMAFLLAMVSFILQSNALFSWAWYSSLQQQPLNIWHASVHDEQTQMEGSTVRANSVTSPWDDQQHQQHLRALTNPSQLLQREQDEQEPSYDPYQHNNALGFWQNLAYDTMGLYPKKVNDGWDHDGDDDDDDDRSVDHNMDRTKGTTLKDTDGTRDKLHFRFPDVPDDVLNAHRQQHHSQSVQLHPPHFDTVAMLSRSSSSTSSTSSSWFSSFYAEKEGAVAVVRPSPKPVGRPQTMAKAPSQQQQRRHFVIHVGPQKTATTYIQGKASRWKDSYLQLDGYVYVGKRAAAAATSTGENRTALMYVKKPGQAPRRRRTTDLEEAVKDYVCRNQVHQAVMEAYKHAQNHHHHHDGITTASLASFSTSNLELPPCWQNFKSAFDNLVQQMNQGEDDDGDDTKPKNPLQHIFLSSEDLKFHKGNSTGWWRAVQEYVGGNNDRGHDDHRNHHASTNNQNHNFDVVVVVAYRRLFEWIVSAHGEKSYGSKTNHFFTRWPVQGGRRVQGPVPSILSSEYIAPHRTSANNSTNQGQFLYFAWTSTQLQAIPDFMETRLLNIHAPRSTGQKFFCSMLPSAPHSCQAALEEEALEAATGVVQRSNSATPYLFDYIAIAMADRGMVDITEHTRSTVRYAVQKYQGKTLQRHYKQVPEICPSTKDLQPVLDASLFWERQLLGATTAALTEDDHRKSFWKAVQSNKYCFLDEDAFFQLGEYKPLFEKFKS